MTKISRHRHEELVSRLILGAIVLAIVVLLGILGWRLWVSGRTVKTFVPQPAQLSERMDAQRVETACYEAYVPKDFEITKNLDCKMNAYARPRKHSYFQVSPYYSVGSEEAMMARWREWWLTLGAEERAKDRVMVGGRAAWRLEELYPQNSESFVTYLVFLDEGIRIDGAEPIRAFELRGWATSEADRLLATEILQDWHWRF